MGEFQLEVRAYDPYGDFCNYIFRIVVQDTIRPVWDEIHTDQFIEFGDDLVYNLNASDLSGIDHWWINDSSIFSITNDGLIKSTVTLSIAVYSLEVRVYDPYGNYCNATFKITVQDTKKPTLVEIPTDQFIEFGVDLVYDLNASDLSGIDHWWTNDTSIFSIANGGILTNTVTLSPDVYFLEIRVYDPYANFCNATFKITVLDTIKPALDELPVDQYLELGDDLVYDLNASDLSGIDHWWINDTSTFSITDGGILTNIITLSPNVYFLEIRVYDPYGNFYSSVIKVTVKEKLITENSLQTITNIAITSILGGISACGLIIYLLRKRKHANL